MAEMSTIGKYEIRRELGRGAMGVVYEGYDPMIKRIVALKTIRADQLAGENAESAIARFRREAQAAGRLNHPNIVSIYDIGEEGGTWYIAMEFIKGRELKNYFEANERFAPADIVRIMTQILDALGYSHQLGVIHRDIKPANVILLADGGVKVADFGIAHIESSNMTQAGTVMGTPSYMSPEQIMGLPDRRALRSLLRRRHPVPVPDRRAPVQRLGDRHDAQGAGGRSAAAVALQRAGAGRDGRRRAQGAREAPRRALSERRRIRRRVARRRPAHAARKPTAADATVLAAPADATRHRARRTPRRTQRIAPAAAGAERRMPGDDETSRRRRRSRRRRPSRSSPAVAVIALGAVALVADSSAPGGDGAKVGESAGAPHGSAADRRRHAAPPRRRRRAAPAPRRSRSRIGDHLRRRPRRSQRPALQRRQVAAAIRSARGCQEPARREGARAHGRSRFAREELRHRPRQAARRRAATTFRRSSRRARRASARTASCR